MHCYVETVVVVVVAAAAAAVVVAAAAAAAAAATVFVFRGCGHCLKQLSLRTGQETGGM